MFDFLRSSDFGLSNHVVLASMHVTDYRPQCIRDRRGRQSIIILQGLPVALWIPAMAEERPRLLSFSATQIDQIELD